MSYIENPDEEVGDVWKDLANRIEYDEAHKKRIGCNESKLHAVFYGEIFWDNLAKNKREKSKNHDRKDGHRRLKKIEKEHGCKVCRKNEGYIRTHECGSEQSFWLLEKKMGNHRAFFSFFFHIVKPKFIRGNERSFRSCKKSPKNKKGE